MSEPEYAWFDNGEGRQVYRRVIPKERSRNHYAMSDIAPFVTQDGVAIGSRSSLREYEQRTGTKQIGNDFASLARQLKGEG